MHLKFCFPDMLTSLFNLVSVINGMCYFCFTVMDGCAGAMHNLVITSHSIQDIITKIHSLTRVDKCIFTLYLFISFSLTSLYNLSGFPCKIPLVALLLKSSLLTTPGITLPQELSCCIRLYMKVQIQMCNSFIWKPIVHFKGIRKVCHIPWLLKC